MLLAIVLAGLVGLALNGEMRRVTESALGYDIDLEDEGDDLRVAVLDMRHYHRNLVYGGASAEAVEEFDQAYEALLEEIGELEELGIRDAGIPQPSEIRAMTERYYADFRSMIPSYAANQVAFTAASEHGLDRLAQLGRIALAIDRLGEARATTALETVERTSATAGLVLLLSVIGLVAVGATLGYATMRVIAELDRLNDQQRESAVALAQASQAKTDFIADVSHELRTPLTVLRGNAEVGLDLEADCIHKPMLEQIVDESARMASMLEDLLFLARSDSSSMPLKLESVEVEPFLTDLAARAETLARQRGVTLRSDLAGEGRLLIDRARIEQAVLNLVDNAAKYSPPEALVLLRATDGEGELCVEVADNGTGIPEEDLPRIFDRFYRVDKTRTRRHGGVGLGLSIVKTVIEAHDGRIEAASRVGEGTRVWFHLPLEAEPRPDREPKILAMNGSYQ